MNALYLLATAALSTKPCYRDVRPAVNGSALSPDKAVGTSSAVAMPAPHPSPLPTVRAVSSGGGDLLGPPRVKCAFCAYESSSSNNVVRHERTHTGVKPFACHFCAYRSTRSDDLAKHVMRHGVKPRLYTCDHCSYVSVDVSNLRRHERTHGQAPRSRVPPRCRRLELIPVGAAPAARHAAAAERPTGLVG